MKYGLYIIVFLISLAGYGWAQPGSEGPQQTGIPNMGWLVVKTLVLLALIIGLIFALVWAMKKLMGKNLGFPGQEGWFQVVARVPLHQNQSVALVKVVDRVMLLGITEHCITNLGEIPDSPALQQLLNNPVQQTVPGSVFKNLLKGKLNG